MEWTDSALKELDQIVDRVRASLNPNEVDVEEVAEDIQHRIEEELAKTNGSVFTEANVRSAAARIGVDEIAEPRDPMSVELEQRLSKPARVRSKFTTGCFWFAGIILPIIALIVEVTTRICLETGLPDPLPTPFHVLLIALVPAFNYLAWRQSRGGKTLSLQWLSFLGGIAFIAALYNAILFAVVTPFALIGFAAIIYFGIGLICFLPLSPLLSFLATGSSLTHLRKTPGLPKFKLGVLVGLIVLTASSAPRYITLAGLRMASSKTPETATKGIKLLRTVGDKTLMNRSCYWGPNMPADPFARLVAGGTRVKPADAREIYYRATGEAFHTKAAPTLGFRNRRDPGAEFDWDPETGGDVVAGRLKGLSLSDSRMDGKIDPDAATAYLEWTMVFKNEWSWEREARAQIALPPGAVVSRLTLWIDGEPREAAFGGRSQVKQAYKKVVRRRRDPVLVTTYGPDRVLMQCYPVPADGEMKIRVGMTVPLAPFSETDRAMKLPCFLERNFRIPSSTEHAVWIGDVLRDDLTDTELNDALVKTSSDSLAAAYKTDEQFVVQNMVERERPATTNLNLVIDGSTNMRDHIEPIAAALKELPPNINVRVFVAGDEAQEIHIDDVAKLKPTGGMDNCAALREALMDDNTDHVLWIHGPQEWGFDACEKIRQVMERDLDKRIFAYQIGHGPHRLIEKMDNLAGFITVPASAYPEQDLERFLALHAGGAKYWTAERMLAKKVDSNIHRADDHLERLYVFDQINADLSDGDNDSSNALALALEHHLVTPVSGAVVLETQQQYADANLKPIDGQDAPSVPEPGVLMLFLFASLLLFFGPRLYRHARAAIGIYD